MSPARPADIEAIAALLEEMDRFYGAAEPEAAGQRTRQISEAIFAAPPSAFALVARDGAQLAGIASYSLLWPAVGLTRSVYLKELYVSDGYRRQRVGQLLMNGLFDVAAKLGCSRVEWTTDTDNAGAQAFYESLGVPVQRSKLFYRVEDSGTGFQPPG